MKTNILAGIAISLLLVLPAAASDYTLGVFGNANENDTSHVQNR
jgi:iron complex transport system substrate-binding protein